MDTPLYTIHARALLSESTLNAEERKILEETVAPAGRAAGEGMAIQGRMATLPTRTDLHVRPRSKSARVYLQPMPDGRPEVLDFVHQETLDWLWSHGKKSEAKRPRKAGSRT